MNLIRKREGRAKRKLIRRYGYSRDQFESWKDEEPFYFRKRLPKGTALVWEPGGYYEPRDGDFVLPSCILGEIEYWTKWEE